MKRAILTLLLGAAISHAQNPQVPVTGNLGAGGNFTLINSPALAFSTDADHLMSYPETSGSSGVLVVTSSASLTATRNVVAPLMKGFEWLVRNATTGGQSIQIIGSSGSGVTIANGSSALVFCDGTNYLSLSGGMIYPGAGVANSTGSSWGASYAVGTGANNLVQLNSSSALPAVSGANLSNLNGASLQASSVANAALANSSMTINSAPCALGGSCTIPGTSLGGALSGANCTVGPGAGTGASCSVVGFDGNHHVEITLGSSPSASDTLYTMTFTASRGHTSYCTFSYTVERPSGTPYQGAFVDSSSSPTQYIMDAGADITNFSFIDVNVSCP